MSDSQPQITKGLTDEIWRRAEEATRGRVPKFGWRPTSTLPTHEAASRIAAAARDIGFAVRRSAASPQNRSAYVFCGAIKVRVADHPNREMPDIDVHVDESRPGSVSCDKAIEWLRGRLP